VLVKQIDSRGRGPPPRKARVSPRETQDSVLGADGVQLEVAAANVEGAFRADRR
jgi:hypothetical protein